MTNGAVLGEVVRQWAEHEFPGEDGGAKLAADVARAAYEQGATVSSACEQARAVLSSLANHPSRWRVPEVEPLPVAS